MYRQIKSKRGATKTMSFDDTFQEILGQIEEGNNIMLHGAGGVGKTYMIKKLRDNVKKNMVLTSTTGVSAFNVGDGCTTINSFACVMTGDRDPAYYVRKCRRNPSKFKRIKETELLVIDEISMLGMKLLELVDKVFKAIRQDKNPFGGIQVLFSGDFYQLPPVKDDWCFRSDVWNDLNLNMFSLTKPQRHKSDKSFFRMLMRVREGKPKNKDLIALQKKHIQYYNMSEKERDELNAVQLFSTNNNVDSFNQDRLAELEEKEWIYSAIYSKKDAKKLTQGILNDIVVFKKGAQVMLTVNLCVVDGLVNGATGIVKDCGPGFVAVDFANGLSRVLERYEYVIDEENNIKAWQIPLRLAWAISIHKSQSATIPKVVIDLGNCFERGQAYVALSRCQTLDGIYLTDFNTSSIKTNQCVIDFLKE